MSVEKVVIITNAFPPELGAASGRIYSMAQGLRQKGYHVTVLTALPNYPLSKVEQRYRNKVLVKEQMDGIDVRRHWLWTSNKNSIFARAMNMFSLAVSIFFFSLPLLYKLRPQWIFVQYPPIALPMFSTALAKMIKTRLVVNFSDLWPSAMVDLGVIKPAGLSDRWLRKIEKWVCSSAFACLAQSQEVVDYLAEAYNPPRLLLYRTGVYVNDFQVRQHSVEFQSQPNKLVYLGVLGMAQGLLEVCQQVSFADYNCELHIYGDGMARQGLAQYVADSGRKDIILHGSVMPAQIPAILAHHDAAFIAQKTRIRGTVPSKIYEALAAGLPIIFHGGGEGGDIVKRSGGWVSTAGDSEVLKRHIQEFSNTLGPKRQSIANKGRAMAVEEYDRPYIVDGLLEEMALWKQ